MQMSVRCNAQKDMVAQVKMSHAYSIRSQHPSMAPKQSKTAALIRIFVYLPLPEVTIVTRHSMI